ncbi:MAG: hypothetical protein BRD51_06805 [Bacteroidetes bacterium SW_11_64_17]|nr:MAG: hypothetical protein BRD51_06805 [Bacteroidetes bacterium SW_11_64_17]
MSVGSQDGGSGSEAGDVAASGLGSKVRTRKGRDQPGELLRLMLQFFKLMLHAPGFTFPLLVSIVLRPAGGELWRVERRPGGRLRRGAWAVSRRVCTRVHTYVEEGSTRRLRALRAQGVTTSGPQSLPEALDTFRRTAAPKDGLLLIGSHKLVERLPEEWGR